MKETNPEIWERIKREAERDGVNPYVRLYEYLMRTPGQFVAAKKGMKNERPL